MKKYLLDIERKTNVEDKQNFNIVLTQNERNTPLPKGLFKKFVNSLTEQDITFYPNLKNFKRKLRVHFLDFPFLLTPGSDIAIKTFFELFELKGKNIVTSDYYFPMYKVYSDLYQADLKFGSYKSMKLDIQDLIDQVDSNTAFIILANPNSPLGDYTSAQDIKKILDIGIPVLIDEAYIEYTQFDSLLPLLKDYNNLFITRTFSKGLGAAGLRVGAIITTESNIEFLNKFRFMYEISSISAKYCEYILDNIDTYRKEIVKNLKKKTKMVKKLSTKFTVVDTDSSWFFVLDNKDKFKSFLTKNKISTRTLSLPGNTNEQYYKVNYDPELEQYISKLK